jgi:hypothetical protein
MIGVTLNDHSEISLLVPSGRRAFARDLTVLISLGGRRLVEPELVEDLACPSPAQRMEGNIS